MCIKNCKKVLLAGLAAFGISLVFGFLTCGWLFNWVYLLEPVSIWKPYTASLMTYNIIGTLVLSIILAAVYAVVYKGLPAKDNLKKGVQYGLVVWLVGVLPGMYALFNWTTMNTVVVVYWLAAFLVRHLLVGAAIGAIYKEK